jgi:ATP-binding cassette subfamily B protein
VKALLRALQYLKPYVPLTLLALVALTLSSIGNLVIPGLSQRIVDQGIGERRATLIITLSLAMVGLAVLRSIFTFAQGYWAARVSQGVAYDLRNLLYAKIQSLSFSYHDSAQTGQLLTRVTSDVDMVQQFLGAVILQVVGGLVLLIGSLSLMLSISARTAVILLVLAPLAIIIFAFFFSRMRPLFREAQQRLANLNVALEENLVGVRVVRAFVRRAHEEERFEARNRAVLDVQLNLARIMAFGFPLVFLIANLATLGVTWVGGLQVIQGQMTLGELVAFSNYIMMVIFPIFMLSFLLATAAQSAAGAERIFEILDAPTDITERPDAYSLPPTEGRVAFEHVSFRYFAHQPWILKDVDFSVEPGSRVALLGATGSGKSTITNLIPRFYDASEGTVRIDGYDVRDVTLASLRQQVGIVLQETLLFAGTVRENIAFGRPDASLDEIVTAARAAQAHEFIAALPAGYETQVGERGVTLSGGQKQRIAIARALLVDPAILILDDAMSSVDFETELRLRRALDALMVDRTSFVIAQRVSTVQDADLILVLDGGRIAAMGRHDALLEESALYAEIYYDQLEGEHDTDDFLVYNGATATREVTP